MNTLSMVLAAVDQGNKDKKELNMKQERYLKIFQEKNLEKEYQAVTATAYQKEKQFERR